MQMPVTLERAKVAVCVGPLGTVWGIQVFPPRYLYAVPKGNKCEDKNATSHCRQGRWPTLKAETPVWAQRPTPVKCCGAAGPIDYSKFFGMNLSVLEDLKDT